TPVGGTYMAAQSEKDAVKQVDKHVSPKECFVWFMDNKRGYEPIPGTGCAHWVAHEKGWNSGKESSNGCKKNYLIRVKDIVSKSGSEVAVKDGAVGNVWWNGKDGKDGHCGIVSKVTLSWYKVQMESWSPVLCESFGRFETRLVLFPGTEKTASGGPGGGDEPLGRRHGCGEI